jgi:catechol 2,3-dioxygenase-like lactoylglutathione lyase family enzyme
MQSPTTVSNIGVAMFTIADQDAAIAYYTQTLGWELRADVAFGDEGGNRWVEVAPPGAATAIALVQPRPSDPIGIDTHIGLFTDDIDADHAALKARGVDVDGEVSRMGGPVPPLLWFRDQDGNTLMLAETGA